MSKSETTYARNLSNKLWSQLQAAPKESIWASLSTLKLRLVSIGPTSNTAQRVYIGFFCRRQNRENSPDSVTLPPEKENRKIWTEETCQDGCRPNYFFRPTRGGRF